MTTKPKLDPAKAALRQVEAQQVACPRCRSAAGTPCMSIDGKDITYHPERYSRSQNGW